MTAKQILLYYIATIFCAQPTCTAPSTHRRNTCDSQPIINNINKPNIITNPKPQVLKTPTQPEQTPKKQLKPQPKPPTPPQPITLPEHQINPPIPPNPTITTPPEQPNSQTQPPKQPNTRKPEISPTTQTPPEQSIPQTPTNKPETPTPTTTPEQHDSQTHPPEQSTPKIPTNNPETPTPTITSLPKKRNPKPKPSENGLLHYRKWWERHKVEISVNGKTIKGTPIFIQDNTIRVVDDHNSYFIPLDHVEYIKTQDGITPTKKEEDSNTQYPYNKSKMVVDKDKEEE